MTFILGLTNFGIFHTAISLIAVGSGCLALLRDKKISYSNLTGQIYVITTAVTCLTGFGIFQHGGFGKAHALGIVTLIVLAFALVAGSNIKIFGRRSKYVETIAYSTTFFLHLIPGISETTSRLPLAEPWATGPEDPKVQSLLGLCFILFLLALVLQIRQLNAENKRD